MDTYALGLRKAAKMRSELKSMVNQQCTSRKTEEIGQRIEDDKATLEDCVDYEKAQSEHKKVSGKQELFECVRNRYLYNG